MDVYAALGIEKRRIEKRQAWQNYIESHLYVIWNLNVSENCQDNVYYVDLTLASSAVFKDNEGQFHIINIARKMSDAKFARATSWGEALAIHRRFMRDYNLQRHWAHENREDGRHSPAQVLGWHKGTVYPTEFLDRILFATRYTRHLDKNGFLRFQNWKQNARAGPGESSGHDLDL